MIEINELLFNYNKKTQVFHRLDLEIKSGGVIGLLGRNGAGKTTLLKLLTGMLIPKGGEIGIDGLSPGKREPELLRKIFLIPEEVYSPVYPISSFLQIYSPLYPDFDKSKFLEILETFELKIEQKFTDLSYGQKKRIWLAFALSTNCKIILMDEPTNGLDIPSKTIFRKLVSSELRDDKIFIISSHQIRDIDTILDSLIIIEEGEIKLHNSIEDISKMYKISTSSAEPDEEIIYQEKVVDGYKFLHLNSDHTESNMDLEFLFNAITDNKMKFENKNRLENENIR